MDESGLGAGTLFQSTPPVVGACGEGDGRSFELRVGLRDSATGRVLRRGFMRRATARDELEALTDFRVFLDPDYILLALLPKVLRLEGCGRPRASLVESLAIEDLVLLDGLYRELNGYPLEGRKGGSHVL